MAIIGSAFFTAQCDKCLIARTSFEVALGPEAHRAAAAIVVARGWSADKGREGGGIYCPSCTAIEKVNRIWATAAAAQQRRG